MNKPTVQIDNARIFKDSYTGVDHLQGNTIDHPRFPSGMYVYTSPIVSIADDEVETENTHYKVRSWGTKKAA